MCYTARMKKFFKTIRNFIFKSSEDYASIHSANSAFYMFTALFPMTMFILNILTMLNVSREFLVGQLFNITPAVFHEFIQDIVDSIAEQSTGLVLSISIITAVWSASSGIYGLMIGLNDIYRTYDTRPYWIKRSICIVYTLIFIAAVGLSLLLMVSGNRLIEFAISHLPHLTEPLTLIRNLKYPMIFVILFFVFSLIYKTFPYMKSDYRMHLPGAAAASLSWLALSWLFALYVQFTNHGLYGSLATIILFLFWLYLCFYIIFLGGEINAMLIDHKYGKDRDDLRRRTRAGILSKEAAIKKKRPMSSQEKYYFRKSTTRNIDSKRIREEMKRIEKEKAKEKEAEK